MSPSQGRIRLVLRKVPSWFWFGLAADFCLVLMAGPGYFYRGDPKQYLLDPILDSFAKVCDAFTKQVGRTLGVRYGYFDFYPNRAVEVFMVIFQYSLPFVVSFLAGVTIYAVIREVRKMIRTA